jgi:hypothetical protein
MLDISNVPEYFNVNMLSNYKLAEIGIPLGRFSEDKARVNNIRIQTFRKFKPLNIFGVRLNKMQTFRQSFF